MSFRENAGSGYTLDSLMAATSKIRLYALAKELKIDTKRLIEEVRREGVRVSVPSNQISKAVADRIRDRFRPKIVPLPRDEPANLTFRPFASLLSDGKKFESTVPGSTQNPLKRLIPIHPKPSKSNNAVTKKPAQRQQKRIKTRPQQRSAPSAKPKNTEGPVSTDCPICSMSFSLQLEMRKHLFSVHAYVLTKHGLAKASLKLLYQPTRPKTKKRGKAVKSKVPASPAHKPRQDTDLILSRILARLTQMSFVELRTRTLQNLKTGKWDAPPDEYLRILNSKTTVKYKINLARRALEIVHVSEPNSLRFRSKRLNWRLLPPGANPFSHILQHYEQLSKHHPEAGYDLERLHKAYSLNPDETYVGLDEFQGYVVFYFQNSATAVLDCPITGNAIYVFGENWKTLARLTKAELLNGRRSEVERIIHRGSWFVRLKATVMRRKREAMRVSTSTPEP